MTEPSADPSPRWLARQLPPGSVGYFVFLTVIAVFILGPLGGITASYMNFSLGFFVGGQVLAGILGSTVTYFYGAEGKHAANFMQTAAASVAGMAAMGVLIQAMVWLGLSEPPAWQLLLYFLTVGMFGVGVGMFFTPLLVDRFQLTFPSGLAVANILRALTDVRLLRRSLAQLFSGMGAGLALPLLLEKAASFPLVARLASTHISTSTVGAGLIVGARIGVPAITYGLLWAALAPWLRMQGWLGPHDPVRKFGFLLALGTIMGAAVVDIALILREAFARFRGKGPASPLAALGAPEDPVWKRTNGRRLVAWIVLWGFAVIVVTTAVLGVPLQWVLLAVALSFLMMLVNGISLGITDSNPISSAFVLSVLAMAALGLADPVAGLLAGSIVFVVCTVGGDMQQDRSTGWRLGTNRVHQFRFQVVGIVVGSVMAVYMAKLFMQAYPVLKIDAFSHPEQASSAWQSAMTFKFVGALRGLTKPQAWQIPTMLVGLAIGIVVESLRKVIKGHARYKTWIKSARGTAFDFVLDAVLLPSPYASSFAGFVDLSTSLWFGGGGLAGTIWSRIESWRKPSADTKELPQDMSTTSLVGGGLIAGDAMAAMILGVIGLLALAK